MGLRPVKRVYGPVKRVYGVEIKRECEGCERGDGGAAAVAAHQYLLDETALAPGHKRTQMALRKAVDAGKAAKAG